MSSSRIFLRNVLRLTPRSSAALIWLPRVEAKAAGGIMYGYDKLSAAGLIEWLKREDQAG